MSGSRAGGLKTAKTIKKLHGKSYYATIGAKGGKKAGIKKGFALNPELAREAGRKGGYKSQRSSTIATADKIIAILRLYDKGLTAADIAKKLGINASAVRYHIRKNIDFTEYLEKHNG